MYWIALIIPAAFVAGHLFLAWRTDKWLRAAVPAYGRHPVCRALVALVFLAGIAMPMLGCFLPDSSLKFTMAAAGNIWLGFFIYYGFICVLLCLLSLPAGRRIRRSRGWAAGCLAFAVLLSLGVEVYGINHATDIHVTHLEQTVDKPCEREGLRVALIADLHISVNSSADTMVQMVEKVNAEHPDVILMAGDLLTSTINGVKDPEEMIRILQGLEAPYGVYGVYGNHDVEENLLGGFAMLPPSKAFRSDAIRDFAGACFTMLSDEVVDIADGSVVLVGREDGDKAGNGDVPRQDASALMAGIDTGKPVIILEHEPVDYRALAENGADVVLSGHTHAGQMFPGTLLIKLFAPNAYGVREIDGITSIVTSGVGFYGPPMRVGCDSEIMIIDFTFNGE